MKILLDECVTRGPSLVLASFFALDNPPVHGEFLLDKFGKPATKDKTWAEVLRDEGGWCVISGDRDRSRKSPAKRIIDGPPTIKILPACGITAVYMSSAIQQAPGPEKVRSITSVWPAIRDFFGNAPPGSRKLVTRPGNTYVLRDF